MTTMTGDANPPAERAALMIRIGGLTIKGPAAIIVLLVILGGIVALVIYSQPSLRMLLSAALWIAFIAYWSAAARHAAPTRSSESSRSRLLHQLLMNAALLLLFVPVPGSTQRFLPLNWPLVIVGLTLQALFGVLAVWARRHLGRNWSGAITVKADHHLVRSGPYRLVRHPIYTAMLGMFAGTALVSGEHHALLALVIVALAYWRKILLEERNMRQLFGAEYQEYQRASWAVIPPIL